MLEINEWFFVQLANFLIVLLFLNYLLFKPLLRIFKERGDRVKDCLDNAKTMEKERTGQLDQVNARISEAKNQAKAIFETLSKEGLEVQKEFIEVAKKEAAEVNKKAQDDLKAEAKKAREALKSDIEAFSGDIVKKLVEV